MAFLGPESQDCLSGWRVIDGRDVYATVLTPEAIAELREVGANVPDDTGFWAYPVGEVLFWIGMPFEWPDGAPTVEDVLAELPFTSPSPEPVPSPGPVGVGLRVELPQYGFALTFPDDWDVVSESPLVARGQEEKCAVMVSPADLPLETIAADHVAWFDGQPNRFPGGATATDVALPAGQAKRIDVRHPEEGWPMLNTSVYLLTHGSRGYSLSCTRKDAPEDRWLSIATTFEFLPAAE